jgi:hypothetical protein
MEKQQRFIFISISKSIIAGTTQDNRIFKSNLTSLLEICCLLTEERLLLTCGFAIGWLTEEQSAANCLSAFVRARHSLFSFNYYLHH